MLQIEMNLWEIPVVADDDDGEFRVESDVGQFCFLLRSNKLFTDRLILVNVQVIHVRLTTTTTTTTTTTVVRV